MIKLPEKFHKGYLFGFIGLFAVGIYMSFWLPRYTTSNAEYCLKCHGDEGGLLNRGIPSKIHPHYSKVQCVECHSQPNQIVYEGYVKGFMAEVGRVTPNCIRCHKSITTRNDIKGFKYNVMKIGIPHKLHLNMGAKCTDCHANISHDLNDKPTNRPRMEYCSQCHATNSEPCAKCHIDKIPTGKFTAVSTAGLVGDGKGLYDKYCSSCHGSNGTGIEGINLQSYDLFSKYTLKSLIKKTLEGHQNMPPFDLKKGGNLGEDEVRAIIAHLKLSSNILLSNGQILFDNYCAVCHGNKGNKIVKTDLSSLTYASKFTLEKLIRVIKGERGGRHAYDKRFGGPLPFEAIASIAKYIPALSQPAVDTSALVGKEAFALYLANCVDCHGQKGNDVSGINLRSADYLKNLGDKKFIKSVSSGTSSMPGFSKSSGGSLTKDDINNILAYFKFKTGLGPEPQKGTTLNAKAPKIPHEVTNDMEDCMECHSNDGIKPFPSDHAGRKVKMCKNCHTTK